MKSGIDNKDRLPVWEREDSVCIKYGEMTLCIPNVNLPNPAQRAILTQDFVNHVLNSAIYESEHGYKDQTWTVYSMHSHWPFFKVENDMYDVEKRASNTLINGLYAIADEWAEKGKQSNLTSHEVAHGVIHSVLKASEGGNPNLPGFEIRSIDENYTSLGNTFYENQDNRKNWPVQIQARSNVLSTLNEEYGRLYDSNKTEEIKAGLVRSAADLFS